MDHVNLKVEVDHLLSLDSPDSKLLGDDNIFFRCVEDCTEPIMISNASGELVYVNPAWTQIYGYSLEEARGQTPRLLRSDLQTDEFYRTMWQQILDPTKQKFKGEVVNRAKDGRLVPVLLTITPFRRSGKNVGYLGIAVDLTERRSLERQILRQDRLASVGMLASGLAHEIGNPLGVIRGRAEIIMETLGQSSIESQKGSLATIISQIDRISGLIESLMRMTRVSQDVALVPVNLESAILEVATLTRDPLNRKGVELKMNQIAADEVILADAHHLQQVLLNLVINSMHAVDEEIKRSGRTNHFIEISSRRVNTQPESQNRVELRIKDTGCGMTDETARRIFEPFYTTKKSGQGTGLGMAIVAKLIEEMKATIEVSSPGPGLGAEVRIIFLSPNERTL